MYEITKCAARICVIGTLLMTANAQVVLREEARLRSDDLVVLDSKIPRTDLSCQIEPVRPYLGFDLRFHTYYRVTMRRKLFELAGSALSVIVRVKPVNQPEPVYLVQQIVVPSLLAETRSMGMFAGAFDVGPGRYQLDWMMRDGFGHACSSHWKLEAKLSFRERNVPLTLTENMIAEALATPFDDEPASRARWLPTQGWAKDAGALIINI